MPALDSSYRFGVVYHAFSTGDGIVEISPLVSYAGENLGHLEGKTLVAPVEVKEGLVKL